MSSTQSQKNADTCPECGLPPDGSNLCMLCVETQNNVTATTDAADTPKNPSATTPSEPSSPSWHPIHYTIVLVVAIGVTIHSLRHWRDPFARDVGSCFQGHLWSSPTCLMLWSALAICGAHLLGPSRLDPHRLLSRYRTTVATITRKCSNYGLFMTHAYRRWKWRRYLANMKNAERRATPPPTPPNSPPTTSKTSFSPCLTPAV